MANNTSMEHVEFSNENVINIYIRR